MEKAHNAVCLVDACFEASLLALDGATSVVEARTIIQKCRTTIMEVVRATTCIEKPTQKPETT
jgi:hypothetical protein